MHRDALASTTGGTCGSTGESTGHGNKRIDTGGAPTYRSTSAHGLIAGAAGHCAQWQRPARTGAAATPSASAVGHSSGRSGGTGGHPLKAPPLCRWPMPLPLCPLRSAPGLALVGEYALSTHHLSELGQRPDHWNSFRHTYQRELGGAGGARTHDLSDYESAALTN
jgi:hypothetical protein